MFLYHTQRNSEIMVVQIDIGDYQMTYHHMQQHQHRLISFTQSRIATEDEAAYIIQWIGPLYEEHGVINLFRDSFQRMIHQDELQVTRRY